MNDVSKRDERGQVVVLFALLLPVFFGIAAIVVGGGNWFVHGKHLQTKADAGALAGGAQWEFPCGAPGSTIDTQITDTANLYAGAINPQVGGVPNADVKIRLNASDWYDDDSNPGQANFDDPTGSVCSSMILDVKATEDNSFPLASLLPLFPDIKRKARVQIEPIEGADGILPVAVRAPEPTSAAAIFYNEENQRVLAVRYLVKDQGISGLPGSLQGWTTLNTQDLNYSVPLSSATSRTIGVVMAVSYRGACSTNLPPGNTNITTSVAPCFEDEYAPNTLVSTFCNQGTPQVVSCYYSTTPSGSPIQTVQSGLHFIRGVPSTSPGTGPPGLEEAWLENLGCSYFAQSGGNCTARLHVSVNLGALNGLYTNPSPPPAQVAEPLHASDVDVQYCKVTPASNPNECNAQFGPAEQLTTGNGAATGTVSYATSGASDPVFAARSGANAFAIQIRVRNAQNASNAACALASYNANCRYFYTATNVTSNNLTSAEILASPVQRAFRGTLVTAGSTLWLRLTRNNCPGTQPDNEAGEIPAGSTCNYIVDAGLKGALAKDADEPTVIFTDGTAANQVGGVACNPGGQGPILSEAVKYGCEPEYGKHPFNYLGPDPAACPAANDLFMNYPTGNPGSPWDDGSWPPLRCIDTRQTGTGNQLQSGLNWRLFDNPNNNFGPCPTDANGFVKGRNYWKKGTNMAAQFGYKDDSFTNPNGTTWETHFDPGDPRLVTIFVSTPEAFAYANNKTYPITGFMTIYITGFATLGDAVNGINDDPCDPGGATGAPPADLECSQNQCNNYVVWGHILKREIPGPRAHPSGGLCDPQAIDPCVATLVQ